MNSLKSFNFLPVFLGSIFVIVVLTVLSCWFASGGGTSTGYIYKYAAINTPPVGTFSVSVRNRSDLSIEIPSDKFKNDEGSGAYFYEFDIDGLVKNQSYVYEVRGPSLQTALSFPLLKAAKKTFIGGLDFGLFSNIVAAITAGGVAIDSPNLGIIVGVHNPLNLSESICGAPVNGMALIDKVTGETAPGDWKVFFFSKQGHVSVSPPPYDGYIIVNVPPGIYNLAFSLSGATGYSYALETLSEPGRITFGYMIPCQLLENFDYKP